MNPRLGSAVRFALALAIVNLSALAIFGSGTATTAASFATIGSLYFLDYDGRARERLGAYSLSTLVAVVGLVLGCAVQGNLPLTIIIGFALGFVFAAARAFRGLIARSFIGTQLAFVLAVFTPNAWTTFDELILGWMYGAAISVVCALLIFPRHHAGLVRNALSKWALAVAAFMTGDAVSRQHARASIAAHLEELESSDHGSMLAGLWSKRTRALAAMELHAHQMSAFLDLIPADEERDSGEDSLISATARGFTVAGNTVPFGTKPAEFSPVEQARDADFTRLRADAQTSGGAVPSDFAVRVLSIGASTMQYLAAASRGWKITDPIRFATPQRSVRDMIREAFSHDSVWMLHGLRTGFAIAGSIALATAMGLEHGVWVVMTTLSIINISFTATVISRNAGKTIAGVVLGASLAALTLAVVPQWWMLAALVPLIAGLAKWCLPMSSFFTQLTYAPFAILNVAMLGWPNRHGLGVIRIEDIVVGLSAGIVATLITFPFGLRKLLERTWMHAHDAAREAIAATADAVRQRTAIDERLAIAQARTFERATAAIDTVFASGVPLGHRQQQTRSRQRWLSLAIFGQLGMSHLTEIRQALPADDVGAKILIAWTDESVLLLDQADPERRSS